MTSPQRRKTLSIALGAICLVLLAALATLNAFRLSFLNPKTTPEIFVYPALSALAFLLFLAVVVLLVRSVLKLYAEQRTRLLGFRLRTRMLWGSVLVALVPIVFMLAFSYLLMNRAVDRWFSQPVTSRCATTATGMELAADAVCLAPMRARRRNRLRRSCGPPCWPRRRQLARTAAVSAACSGGTRSRCRADLRRCFAGWPRDRRVSSAGGHRRHRGRRRRPGHGLRCAMSSRHDDACRTRWRRGSAGDLQPNANRWKAR